MLPAKVDGVHIQVGVDMKRNEIAGVAAEMFETVSPAALCDGLRDVDGHPADTGSVKFSFDMRLLISAPTDHLTRTSGLRPTAEKSSSLDSIGAKCGHEQDR